MSSLPSERAVPRGLVESWRADTASPAELRRGYSRFLRAQARSAPSRLLARWLVFGVVLGGGLAQGATIISKHWPSGPGRSLVVSAPPASKPSAGPRWSVPRAAPVATQAPEAQLPITAPAAPTAAEGPMQKLDARSASKRAASQRWQQAAAAMRVHDFAGADSALRELELTTQGSEREAVLLTRAQLLASAGRSAEALALARLVQARSTSSMIRDKAGKLADRLNAPPTSERSTLPSAAIKQP